MQNQRTREISVGNMEHKYNEDPAESSVVTLTWHAGKYLHQRYSLKCVHARAHTRTHTTHKSIQISAYDSHTSAVYTYVKVVYVKEDVPLVESTPSLISLMVTVDVKHHVYLLTGGVFLWTLSTMFTYWWSLSVDVKHNVYLLTGGVFLWTLCTMFTYLLVEFMYLAFTRMPSESYRRRLRSSLLYLSYVF